MFDQLNENNTLTHEQYVISFYVSKIIFFPVRENNIFNVTAVKRL